MDLTIDVNIPQIESSSYPIFINDETIAKLKETLDEKTQGKKRLVIFSQKVYKLYGKILNFDKKEIFILEDGENQKTLKNFQKIIEKAISLQLSRKDVIIAIGGGVVGDMSGFVASSYMRGIEYIQVPTTLLACVDSSVGGKTAIDMPNGKNYVGAFYQPSAVYINTNFLKTLDEKQYKSGFGEVIKYAFIEKSCNCSENYNLLEYLQTNKENYEKREDEFLCKIIEICLNLKASVVSQDEKEAGLRKILNLGHTFGHAIEEITKYKRYTHGYGVVQGLMYIFNYALNNGFCDKKYYDKAFTLMNIYGYHPDKFCFINKKKVMQLMKTDKKSDSTTLTLIVPSQEKVVVEHKIDKIQELTFSVNYQN